MHYLISSPTRVGSHYCIAIIGSAGVSTEKTHNPKLVVDYENTCLVVVNRRNRFRAVLSASIGRVTNQYHNYVLTNVEPFAIEQEIFKQEYIFNRYYMQQINTALPWARIELMYFEDFFNNFNYVYQRLDLTQKTPIELSEKSPFNYRKIVTNIDECREYFLHLEDTLPKNNG